MEIRDFFTRLSDFYQEKKKIVQIILLLIILSGGGWYYYIFQYQKPLEKKAYDSLSFVQHYIETDSFNIALNGDGAHSGLLKIIEKYPGTAAVNLAYYYAGTIFLKQGLFEKAIVYLTKFKAKNNIIASRSAALLGDAYGEIDKWKRAYEHYQKAASLAKNDEMWASLCLFKAARLIETQDKNKAVALYQKIKQDYPTTPQAVLVDKYLARLGVFF